MADDFLNSPIIVTGCARSGTSLVAGVLHYCGAWIGKCTGPTRWNKKGQFENEHIRDRLTKPFLESVGADPMGQLPLPVIGSELWKQGFDYDWYSKVAFAIMDQGYSRDKPWLFKGAKACLMWPVWSKAFPKARWVVVRRPDSQIVNSCMKTSFMRKRKTRESWQVWVNLHKEYFEEMIGSGLNVRSFWVSEALSFLPDLSMFRGLVEELGLSWDEEKIKDFVDLRLWNGGLSI